MIFFAIAWLLSGSFGGYLIFLDMQRIWHRSEMEKELEVVDFLMILVMSIAGPVGLIMGLVIFVRGLRGE